MDQNALNQLYKRLYYVPTEKSIITMSIVRSNIFIFIAVALAHNILTVDLAHGK